MPTLTTPPCGLVQRQPLTRCLTVATLWLRVKWVRTSVQLLRGDPRKCADPRDLGVQGRGGCRTFWGDLAIVRGGPPRAVPRLRGQHRMTGCRMPPPRGGVIRAVGVRTEGGGSVLEGTAPDWAAQLVLQAPSVICSVYPGARFNATDYNFPEIS